MACPHLRLAGKELKALEMVWVSWQLYQTANERKMVSTKEIGRHNAATSES
jgi:hypothetical protein